MIKTRVEFTLFVAAFFIAGMLIGQFIIKATSQKQAVTNGEDAPWVKVTPVVQTTANLPSVQLPRNIKQITSHTDHVIVLCEDGSLWDYQIYYKKIQLLKPADKPEKEIK